MRTIVLIASLSLLVQPWSSPALPWAQPALSRGRGIGAGLINQSVCVSSCVWRSLVRGWSVVTHAFALQG